MGFMPFAKIKGLSVFSGSFGRSFWPTIVYQGVSFYVCFTRRRSSQELIWRSAICPFAQTSHGKVTTGKMGYG
jgi:hypothetical protein